MTHSPDDARATARVRENLRQWGRQPVALSSPELARDRAERGIATLAAALDKAQQQRRQRDRVRTVALVAAGIVCSAFGAKAWFGASTGEMAHVVPSGVRVSPTTNDGMGEAHARGRLTLHRDGASQVVDGIASLRTGDVVETTDGSGQVNLQRVTRVELGRATKLAITAARPNEQILRLHSGTASFQVDPARQARVVVETDDTKVLVTGTRFSVAADSDAVGAWTAVEVTSGSVLVESGRQTVRLGAGNRWSSREHGSDAHTGSAAPASPNAAPAPTPAASQVAPTKVDSAKGSQASSAGTLAEENGLLQAALTARKQGRGARCVSLLDQLVTRYPRSPLRQEALVLRFRCLRDGGDLDRAKRAAARYLADYPSGFAKEEAAALSER